MRLYRMSPLSCAKSTGNSSVIVCAQRIALLLFSAQCPSCSTLHRPPKNSGSKTYSSAGDRYDIDDTLPSPRGAHQAAYEPAPRRSPNHRRSACLHRRCCLGRSCQLTASPVHDPIAACHRGETLVQYRTSRRVSKSAKTDTSRAKSQSCLLDLPTA